MVAVVGSVELLVEESSVVDFGIDLLVFGLLEVDPPEELELVDAGVLGDVGVLGVSDVVGGTVEGGGAFVVGSTGLREVVCAMGGFSLLLDVGGGEDGGGGELVVVAGADDCWVVGGGEGGGACDCVGGEDDFDGVASLLSTSFWGGAEEAGGDVEEGCEAGLSPDIFSKTRPTLPNICGWTKVNAWNNTKVNNTYIANLIV